MNACCDAKQDLLPLRSDIKEKLLTVQAVFRQLHHSVALVSRMRSTLDIMMPAPGGMNKDVPISVGSTSSSAIHRPSFTSAMSTCLGCVVFYKLNGYVNVGETDTEKDDSRYLLETPPN